MEAIRRPLRVPPMLVLGGCLLAAAYGCDRAPAPDAATASDAAGVVVLRGGWLFDGVGDEVVRNPGIVVRDGEFLAVGGAAPGEEYPGARVVQLEPDEYILPGLFDLHAHYNVNIFGRLRRDETEVNPVLWLANGVTSTFPAGEYNPEDMFALRARIESGEHAGPRLFNSGPYYGGVRPGWDDLTAEEIRADVDYWAERGARGFKAKQIGPEQLRVLIEQAHRHGLTVTGHLGSGYEGSVNPRDAILMGIDRIEHFLGGDGLPPTRSAYASLVEFDVASPEFREIAQLFIDRGVYFDATITAFGYYGTRESEEFELWMDEQKFLTPYMRQVVAQRPARRVNERFERIFQLKHRTIKAFYNAGGGHLITVGTDHPSRGELLAGFTVHRELHALVLSGIPPADALKAATANAARAMGVGDDLGTIESGKFADLFVVQGNPLEDITNSHRVRLVMKAGQLYDPAALFASVENELGPAGAEEARLW